VRERKRERKRERARKREKDKKKEKEGERENRAVLKSFLRRLERVAKKFRRVCRYEQNKIYFQPTFCQPTKNQKTFCREDLANEFCVYLRRERIGKSRMLFFIAACDGITKICAARKLANGFDFCLRQDVTMKSVVL